MFDLIEVELKRIKGMAEQAGDPFLLYLVDMALMQARMRALGLRALGSTAPEEPECLSKTSET
jgi:hypothetical protein